MQQVIPRQPCPACKAKLRPMRPTLYAGTINKEGTDERVVCLTVCFSCFGLIQYDLTRHTAELLPADMAAELERTSPEYRLLLELLQRKKGGVVS